MQPREHYTEARRWAKFPATVLLVTGLLWLLQNYFTLDLNQLGQLTETGVGILQALVALVLIPLGSVAVGIFLLFSQRWAIFCAGPLALAALLLTTADKLQRVCYKFSQYRSAHEIGAYGGAVMTILLILALWALFVLVLLYLYKTWRHLEAAQEWLARPRPKPEPAGSVPASASGTLTLPPAVDEVCLLLPDMDDNDADDAPPRP
jgi:hypothetical protein